ncbi:MAG: S1 RNA-binding domain-containing protein [bacterium]
MNLQQYIERSRIIDLSIVPANALPELLQLLEEDVQLPELVQDYRQLVDGLPRAQLRRLFEARIEWRARQRALERITEALVQRGLSLPPQAVRERALVPHKVDALERAARICGKQDFESEEAWSEALSGLLDVWSGAVNQTLRRGNLKVRLNVDHPDVMQFEEFARRTEPMSDLASHRWQAIRRGLRAGALAVEFDPPLSSIQGHLSGIQPRLGATAAAREVGDLVDEMVLSVLDGYLRGILDQRAEDESIRHAVSQYHKLLTSSPLAAGRIGALSIRGDGGAVGAIIVTEGDIPELMEVIPTDEEAWEDRVSALFEVAGVEQVVIPVSSPATEVLALIRSRLDEPYELLPVRVAALAEARKLLTDPPLSLEPEVASALVLARRALQPADEWEQVDPVAIGLADYQNDLDEERLREALLETLGLFQLDRASGTFKAPRPRPSARAAQTSGRLNPLVKSLADLRPGMTLDGIITNITRFGAFVNIGLSEEGMIHISELSTEYVQTPSDVVSIGDRVQARVLDVEPNKRRIALSLKPIPVGPPLERRPEAGGRNVPLDTRVRRGDGGGFQRRAGRSVGRAQALEQLESLFKKDE